MTTKNAILWNSGDWRPVTGYPGVEASYAGRIRYIREGGESRIILDHRIGPCGSYCVRIPGRAKPIQIGKLVARAWIGPPPEGAALRYLDGDLLNYRLTNLAYGTRAERRADQKARQQRDEQAGSPTHCTRGHRLSGRWNGGYGEQVCNECLRGEYVERSDKVCEDCGILITNALRTRKYCDDCGSARRAAAKPRSYTCNLCHKMVTVTHAGRIPKVCADCRPAYERKGPRTTTCAHCHDTITTTKPGPLPKRCEACRTTSTRKRHRKPPRSITCEWCGTTETVTHGGTLPRVCAQCKPEYSRKQRRETTARYQRKRAAERKKQ